MARIGEPFGTCALCNIAESAHAESVTPYDTDGLPYRCPACVTVGAESCSHTQEEIDSYIEGKRAKAKAAGGSK